MDNQLPQVNNEPEGFKDTPKATFLSFAFNLLVKAIKWFVLRSIQKKEQAEDKLTEWRNSYVQKRNSRIAHVELMRSADELHKKAPTTTHNRKPDVRVQYKR
jgi:hypothetical protein